MNENNFKFLYQNVDKLKGIGTKKDELFGIFRRGGFSSSIPFRKLLFEEIKIRYDNDLLPGMLFLPFCFKEAAANVLTNSELDPIGKIPELKYSAARIYQD